MQYFQQPIRYYSRLLLVLFAVTLATQLASAQDDSGFRYVEVTVVDPDGKPLAEVEVNINTDGSKFPMYTDSKGKVSFNIPNAKNTRLTLQAKHDQYLSEVGKWSDGKSIPKKYTIKLVKGTAIGGIVHDEDGQPIEGVSVMIHNIVRTSNTVHITSNQLATTDSSGRWQGQVLETPAKPLLMRLAHNDYPGGRSIKSLASWKELKTLEHVLVLKKGMVLQGRVTDPEGEPIAGALVCLGRDRLDSSKKFAIADTEGNYRFGNLIAKETAVVVAAQGWAPDLRYVEIREDMKSVDFQLQPGKTMQILVTDPEGVPISGATVYADSWRKHRNLPEKLYYRQTDDTGIWESDSLPEDEVTFHAISRDYMSSRKNTFLANGKTQTIVMSWKLKVAGKVVDAESGLPIEKFTFISGYGQKNLTPPIYWGGYTSSEGTHGKFQMQFREPREGYYVGIQADGYRPAVSILVRDDERNVTLRFEMKAGMGPSGIITTPDGKPAADVELTGAAAGQLLYLENGIVKTHLDTDNGMIRVATDQQGKYVLPFLESEMTLVCLHETGWAQITSKQLAESGDIQLNAWSVIEGTVLEGKQPLVEEQIMLFGDQLRVLSNPQINWGYRVQSDSAGKFRIDRIRCKNAVVARYMTFVSQRGTNRAASSHSQQVKLEPGKTHQIQIGGVGQTVQGKANVPYDCEQTVLWSRGVVTVRKKQPPQDGFFLSLGNAFSRAGQASAATINFDSFNRYATTIDAKGNFSIADVTPGKYVLTIELFCVEVKAKPQLTGQPIGSYRQDFTVDEPSEGGEQLPINLGELVLDMNQPTVPSIMLAPE